MPPPSYIARVIFPFGFHGRVLTGTMLPATVRLPGAKYREGTFVDVLCTYRL